MKTYYNASIIRENEDKPAQFYGWTMPELLAALAWYDGLGRNPVVSITITPEPAEADQ